jgi:hypothetical protein
MSEGRRARTRSAYKCYACDGDGVTDFEFNERCDVCAGTGVSLEVAPPRTPSRGNGLLTPTWLTRNLAHDMQARIKTLDAVNRER